MTNDPDATIHRRIARAGDYDLLRKMGAGGFGVVFEACHRQTGLPYAVKRINLSVEDAERYRNEALYPARIASQSLHVLGVHSFFQDPDEDVFYLVTELVAHGDLRTFLDRNPRPLPVAQALELGIGIAKGLAAIHGQGVIHRDLKPANVLMDRKDEQWVPKITDFGLARSSRSVSIGDFASSGYGAPEQLDLLSTRPLGPESDLFSFGMMLYELLTGEKPTPARDLREYGRWLGARELPPPPSLVRRELAAWPEIDTLMASLLAFDRTRRLDSAADVVRTLTRVWRRIDSRPPDGETAGDAALPASAAPPVSRPETHLPPSVQAAAPTPGVAAPSIAARGIAAPAARPGAADRRGQRRRRLAVMAVVFAATGAAMTYGLPWTNPSKSAAAITEPLFQHPGAPWFAHLSFVVLPMLFGAAVASAARLDAARTVIVALLGLVVYQAATWLVFGAMAVGGLGWMLQASQVAAGLVGALGMLAAMARWRRPSRRDSVLTAIAGLAGGALFAFAPFIVSLFGSDFPQQVAMALAYMSWQILVGLVLVDRAQLAAPGHPDESWPLRPVLTMAAVAVLCSGGGSWARNSVPTSPGHLVENPAEAVHYAWIPPGQFQMGCSADDDGCAADEQPAHTVTFTNGFWLRSREVTVGDWKRGQQRKAADGSDLSPGVPPLPPPALWNGLLYNKDWALDDLPIMNVTWQEAQDYCRSVDGRLPTEAEWEYAVRAGTDGARYGRLRDIAQYADNSSETPVSTAQMTDEALLGTLFTNRNGMASPGRSANAWSLTDMLGNVAEWVEDEYADTLYSLRAGPATDPPAHRTGYAGAPKVVRGGSWASRPGDVRASARARQAPDERSVSVGFRCVWEGPAE